jgi:hypothetical protein
VKGGPVDALRPLLKPLLGPGDLPPNPNPRSPKKAESLCGLLFCLPLRIPPVIRLRECERFIAEVFPLANGSAKPGQPGTACRSWFYHPRRQTDCLFSGKIILSYSSHCSCQNTLQRAPTRISPVKEVSGNPILCSRFGRACNTVPAWPPKGRAFGSIAASPEGDRPSRD